LVRKDIRFTDDEEIEERYDVKKALKEVRYDTDKVQCDGSYVD